MPLTALEHSQPNLPFIRPIGDEFQMGQFLIRRVRGDKFLIWNRDLEMMETDAGKLESTLRDLSSAKSSDPPQSHEFRITDWAAVS